VEGTEIDAAGLRNQFNALAGLAPVLENTAKPFVIDMTAAILIHSALEPDMCAHNVSPTHKFPLLQTGRNCRQPIQSNHP
jgi:hypothetical protein